MKAWMTKGPTAAWDHEEVDIMKRIKKNILANGGFEITKKIRKEEGNVLPTDPSKSSEPAAKKQKKEQCTKQNFLATPPFLAGAL